MSKEVTGLLKTYLQVDREAQSIKEKQIKLAKRIPDISPHPQKPQPNKVKDQVQTLKQKRLQLEKEAEKISQEHDYTQKILQNELRKQLAPQPKQNDILLNLEKVAQETQLTYLKFRTEKFIKKIAGIFAIHQIKREFFHKLKTTQKHQTEEIQKYIEFRNFQLLRNALIGWKRVSDQEKQERKLREEQQVKKYEMGQNQLAVEFHNFCLTNKCFKAIKKFVKMNQINKKFESDQTQIKAKVNTFLNQMQKQIVETMEKEKEEIELIKQSNFIPDEELTISNSQISNQINQNDEIDLENQELQSYDNEFLYHSNEEQLQLTIQPAQKPLVQEQKLEQNSQNSDEIKQQFEEPQNMKQNVVTENERDRENKKQENQKGQQQPPIPQNPWRQKIQPSMQSLVSENEKSIQRQNSGQNLSQQNFTRQKSIEKRNTYVKEQEEKAQKRKEMNEAIKKKHDEKRKQKELEKQQQEQQKLLEIKKQKEEEYNRLQEKKKREQEMKMKKEQEQFELQYKTELAIRHYEKSLQKFQIFYPILQNYERAQRNQQIAINIYQLSLKRKFINQLNKAKRICEEQKEYEEQIKINLAIQHSDKVLKLKIMNIFSQVIKNSKNKMKEAQKVRNTYLIRNILTAWYVLLPELRAENAKLERISVRLINDFRKATVQKRFFCEWREVVQEILAERKREINKQEMWVKVNQWLQELDQDKNE